MKGNGTTFLVGAETEEAKCRPNATKLICVLVLIFAILWFMFSFRVLHYDMLSLPFDFQAQVFGLQQPMHEPLALDLEDFREIKIDKLLGGLLNPGFDDESCLSRYNSALYRKPPTQNPSSPLISKLRNYEALHKRCGPHTKSYREALKNLKSGNFFGSSDCKYVVWISYNGLGNRILSLSSAFLYALVTNRVLLVDSSKDMSDLFCEPFPESSWLLSKDFPPIYQFDTFDQQSNQSYGNMLKTNIFKNISNTNAPPLLFLYLGHDYDDHDKLFFCDEDQSFLRKVPWLIIKSDNYFIPSLFLIPSFEQELGSLFPEKETVFHFLGRYLFHPTNQVWGLVTRFYEAYVVVAHEKIGVQIRVLVAGPHPVQYVFDQILSCLLKEKILPKITTRNHTVGKIKKRETKAVVVTSLNSGYFEKLRDMYWENPTNTSEIISFFQPSHEKYEKNEEKMHNMKAWAEIYLLSLMDKLVTSSWSTFGYVAQGLGGLRPWILYKAENQTAPDPPCRRGVSIEPCFHSSPNLDCKKRTWADTSSLVPYIKRCEDVSWGVKLVDVET